MPFQPGQSGNPGGRKKAKPFGDALRMALADDETAPNRNRTKLDRIVTALLDKAVDGDVPALKEVADRLDGKVAQAIVGGDEDDGPGLFDPLLALMDKINNKSRSV
jgi:hypothetical protein